MGAFLFVLHVSSYQCLQKSSYLPFIKQMYDIAINNSHLYLKPKVSSVLCETSVSLVSLRI